MDSELMDSLREVLYGAHAQLQQEADDHKMGVLSKLIAEFDQCDYSHMLWVVVSGHPDEGEGRKVLFDPSDADDEAKSPATVRPLATPPDKEHLVEMLNDPMVATAFHKLMDPNGYILRTRLADGSPWHGWVDSDGITIADRDGMWRSSFSHSEPPEPKSEEEGELILCLLKSYMMPKMASVRHKHLYAGMLQEIAENDEFLEALGITKEMLLDE